MTKKVIGGAHIGPCGEGLLLAGDIAVSAEDNGAASLVLVQQAAVLEVRHQAALALDARVADVAHLLAVKLLPLLSMEPVEQRRNVLWQDLHIRIMHVQTSELPISYTAHCVRCKYGRKCSTQLISIQLSRLRNTAGLCTATGAAAWRGGLSAPC